MKKHKLEGRPRLRNIEHTNRSMLFNQAWRIHINKEFLVHRIYVAKYKRDPLNLAMDNSNPLNCSYAVRSLIKASSSFIQGIRKKLGNGRTTNIFTDAWLSKRPTSPNQNSNNITTIADLIDDNKNWKTSNIWNSFSRENAMRILSTHIPTEKEEDGIDWKFTNSSQYTPKSGY